MPSFELFEMQDEAYKEKVFPKAVRARVAIEAAVAMGWEKYVGLDVEIIAMEGFGASAPYKLLFPHFGFTAEDVYKRQCEDRIRSGWNAGGTGSIPVSYTHLDVSKRPERAPPAHKRPPAGPAPRCPSRG